MMRSIILALCLLFTSSACVFTFAQKTKSAEEKAQKMVEKLDALLGLTQEQKDKILVIYSKPKDQRGKVDAQLKEILTVEQYKKYQDNKAVEKAKKGEGKTGDKQEKKGGNKSKEKTK
ncbi:hypothetical protein [uncultured Bacteroides sp.]|uniref:hypothetical protein n=1 Tax=uncultured Bacteroides sp. TaxID=162156 RepID=UPI002633E3B6|nr:hypothetical protein [uncultured Bacteroides sp.]